MLLLNGRLSGAVRYGGRGASFCVVIVSLLLFAENTYGQVVQVQVGTYVRYVWNGTYF